MSQPVESNDSNPVLRCRCVIAQRRPGGASPRIVSKYYRCITCRSVKVCASLCECVAIDCGVVTQCDAAGAEGESGGAVPVAGAGTVASPAQTAMRPDYRLVDRTGSGLDRDKTRLFDDIRTQINSTDFQI
ncbi:hypothetical protein [Burkholderia lata]|uniref:hypothetical protein n=1 Tax=Burkholderia lata (strain ATCC 17760 / DSM 23089 / LMG 22485 / NCIMB 9086 / R18194 / 383) TaxID=482957 RepID=UPI001583378B|nr:hypothetical protein [Burkholderia lata]